MRALLVEDARAIAVAVQRVLLAEQFTVDVSGDGEEGLGKARTNAYDVCRALRAADVWTPVLMLTAKDGEYDEADALDLGADDNLTKPFSVIVLVARLRALARRGVPARPLVLHAGDLRLDPGTHRCSRGRTDIPLTAREFSVLEFLLRRPDIVVSKSEIIDGVWDPGFEGDPNIVEVYVRRLRTKIDEPFGRAAIQTVRGVGYRFSVTGG
jgi:DNA-binding response OmpR family regulator